MANKDDKTKKMAARPLLLRETVHTHAGAVAVVFLAAAAALVWSAAAAFTPSGVLSVSFLDVGQGDAILIESPSGAQVLIDAGAGRGVLREISAHTSWLDRTLDVVIATHPDMDHIGGLPYVLERYNVAHVVESGVVDDGADAHALARAIADEAGVAMHTARRGQVFDLGDGALLEVLFPDRDVSGMEPNAGSVIVRLVYGDIAFLLTGDAPQAIEKYLVSLYGSSLSANVLKAGHHGSKTSSADVFMSAVGTTYAVISRGCDNSYGHPHREVLDTLAQFDVLVLDTCERGTITFVSDGRSVFLK
jgi:competence protein ComEC